MTEAEKNIYTDLFMNNISAEEFRSKFTVDPIKKPEYIINLLEEAYISKNKDEVSVSLGIAFKFNIINHDFIEVLIKLMYEPWHVSHENIARVFQKIKSPKTINCLYDTALTLFDYLDDDCYALAVKCIWALSKINTLESREKLKLLSKSDNQIIRDNAIKRLKTK